MLLSLTVYLMIVTLERMMKNTELHGQMHRTEYADVAGGRIAFEVAGQGPLVVLSDAWALKMSALEEGHSVNAGGADAANGP
jgi:hypothetical protein